MAYVVGDLIRVSVTYQVGSTRTDPTIVTFKWKNPAGTTTTWIYLTDNQVVRDGVGEFHADVSVTAAGTWNVRWEGTTAAQGAAQTSFDVTAANP